MQTAIADTGAATTRQEIRNTIMALGSEATTTNIARRIGVYAVSVLYRMEDSGELTRTPTGAYVVGSHATADGGELELTSDDRLFGQPSLF